MTKTRMGSSNGSPVLTGITLAVIGALIAGAGWAASDYMERLDIRRVREAASERYEQRARIQSRYNDLFRERLSGLDRLEFDLVRETATGPELSYPDSFVTVMERTAEEAAQQMEEQFPENDHVVTADLYLTLDGSSGPQPSPTDRWASRSEGVPPEAVSDPQAFRIYAMGSIGDENTVSVTLYTDHQDIIFKYFSDRAIATVNPFPEGVRGLAVLRFHMGGEDEPQHTIYATFATLFTRLSQLGLLFLFLAPPVWVFLDARRRRLPALLWALFVLPTSLIGVLIYALANRDVGPSCPECGERVNPRFSVCPYCRTELKGNCPTCGQTVGADWTYCPSCSTEL